MSSQRQAPPDGPPFRRRNLPLLLLQAREGVLTQFRPILRQHGVTEQQWRVIRALVEGGDLEPRQIGGACGLSSPSLAGVLARMEDLGWVTRVRVASDQRRVRVSATAQARALAHRMAPAIEAIYQAMESRMGAQRVQQLYETLDFWVASLSDGAPGDEPAC